VELAPAEGISAEAAEVVARSVIGRLGYVDVLGVACAVEHGASDARCSARVREESATHIEGETDVVMISWRCNATGCWRGDEK